MSDKPTGPCPYGPRHRDVDQLGRCGTCGGDVPAPWYMRRQPYTPAQTVAQIAAQRWPGTNLGPTASRDIARAMFDYATHSIEARHLVHRVQWETASDGYQERIRADLLHKLMAETVNQQALPVALPSHARRHIIIPTSTTDAEPYEVPNDIAAQDAAWNAVELIVAWPVRYANLEVT